MTEREVIALHTKHADHDPALGVDQATAKPMADTPSHTHRQAGPRKRHTAASAAGNAVERGSHRDLTVLLSLKRPNGRPDGPCNDSAVFSSPESLGVTREQIGRVRPSWAVTARRSGSQVGSCAWASARPMAQSAALWVIFCAHGPACEPEDQHHQGEDLP